MTGMIGAGSNHTSDASRSVQAKVAMKVVCLLASRVTYTDALICVEAIMSLSSFPLTQVARHR